MKWLKELVFGKNGFDAEKHEAEVTQIKRRTEACMDETQANFGRVRDAFDDLTDAKDLKPGDHPSMVG